MWTIQVRLVASAASFVACARITVIACVAAVGNDFRIGFTSVAGLVAENIVEKYFRNWRLVIVAIELLNVMNACPL